MMLDWNRLLSYKRFGDNGQISAPQQPESNRTHFEGDCDRIVYSEPFRRLSKKTQVHPFPQNDHVRTRLTHSLEVASVGRSLAKHVSPFLIEKSAVTKEQTANIVKVVEAACLAHDIGNPPFGHAGEHAIREWVTSHEDLVFEGIEGVAKDDLPADFRFFEGNAQAFRVAARRDNKQTGYLRLTLATLASMQKYPWAAGDDRTKKKGKCGFFSTERQMYGALAAELGLESKGNFCRHPLSFLVEAADDISYSVADTEDAVKMNMVKREKAIELYQGFSPDLESRHTTVLEQMRGVAVESLVAAFADVFRHDYDCIMRGGRTAALKTDLPSGIKGAFDEVDGIYTKSIFSDRSKIAYEIGAYKAIGRIIRALVNAARSVVEEHGRIKKANFVARRTLELCWDQDYLEKAERSGNSVDYAWWLHQIFDYIAGLTDDFARRLSREFEGV